MRILLAVLLGFCAVHAAAGETLKLRYGHEPRIRVRFAERKYPQVTEALAQLVTSAGNAPSPVTGS